MAEAAGNRDDSTLAAQARRLIRGRDRAVLATALKSDGWPYGSLVLAACGQDASPLLLLSDLAEHTRNLKADARASLVFEATEGLDDPLTGTRITALGRLEKTGDPALLARYVARHPSAETYAGFGDFNLYRMAVERVHLVAGFGVIRWIAGEAVCGPAFAAPALAEAEPGIVAHMNQDHADAIALYATWLAGHGAAAGDGWIMTGIDAEGLDLRRGGAVARIGFEKPVEDSATARAALVALVAEARRHAATANS